MAAGRVIIGPGRRRHDQYSLPKPPAPRSSAPSASTWLPPAATASAGSTPSPAPPKGTPGSPAPHSRRRAAPQPPPLARENMRVLIRPRRDSDLAACAGLVREVHALDRYPLPARGPHVVSCPARHVRFLGRRTRRPGRRPYRAAPARPAVCPADREQHTGQARRPARSGSPAVRIPAGPRQRRRPAAARHRDRRGGLARTMASPRRGHRPRSSHRPI
jgi:hypothetical protein